MEVSTGILLVIYVIFMLFPGALIVATISEKILNIHDYIDEEVDGINLPLILYYFCFMISFLVLHTFH